MYGSAGPEDTSAGVNAAAFHMHMPSCDGHEEDVCEVARFAMFCQIGLISVCSIALPLSISEYLCRSYGLHLTWDRPLGNHLNGSRLPLVLICLCSWDKLR
jgi:hypothetical protein